MRARRSSRSLARDDLARLRTAHSPRSEDGGNAFDSLAQRDLRGREPDSRSHGVSELRREPLARTECSVGRVVGVGVHGEDGVREPALDALGRRGELLGRQRERAAGDGLHLALDPEVEEEGGGGERPLGGDRERVVLAEDRLLELLEAGARLDSELVEEGGARRPVRVERLGLATRAVEREHQLRAERLAQRVLGDERLQLRHELGRAAGREVGLDPLLDRRDVLLLEPGGLERELAVAERVAAPETQRLAQQLGGAWRLAAPRRGDELVEAPHVDVPLDEVAGLARLDRTFSECLAEARDVDLQRRGRGRRRLVAPELVDQVLRRHDPTGVQGEHGEQGALLAAADRDRPSVDAHLERTEQGVVHLPSFSARLGPEPTSV